ncbi:MAG: ankyrin repeat domain-containing protein [Parashewanella sp.]
MAVINNLGGYSMTAAAPTNTSSNARVLQQLQIQHPQLSEPFKGATIQFRGQTYHTQPVSKAGRLESFCCCSNNCLEKPSLLHRYRARELNTFVEHYTQLQSCIENGDVQSVKRLLNAGLSANTVLGSGLSLLAIATGADAGMGRNNIKMMEMLLAHGADAAEVSTDKITTALEFAVKYGRLNAVKLLLNHGAKATMQELKVAVERNHEKVLGCLIQKFGFPTSVDEDDSTLLQQAYHKKYFGCFASLLINGADPDKTPPNAKEKSVRSLAVAEDRKDYVAAIDLLARRRAG